LKHPLLSYHTTYKDWLQI